MHKAFSGQTVELVRAGKTPDELSRAIEPSARSVRNRPAVELAEVECGESLNKAGREELCPSWKGSKPAVRTTSGRGCREASSRATLPPKPVDRPQVADVAYAP